MNQTESQNAPRLIDYLKLMRFANVFTAIADIGMGFVFVSQSFFPSSVFVLLCIASSLLYLAGMVLNDVYDVELDKIERPERVLPSGLIDLKFATNLGYGMLFAGILVAFASGFLNMNFVESSDAYVPWRSGAIAGILAVCIVAYDAILKKTWLGPIAMGLCRVFNVLLGMSIAGWSGSDWVLGFDIPHLIVAGGIGVYITGVTIFARTEAEESNRGLLIGGLMVMVAGIGMLCSLAFFSKDSLPFDADLNQLQFWPWVLVLFSLGIFRNAIAAIANPTPANVQGTIKLCIMSLIIFDAAVAVIAAPRSIYLALGILALLLPMLWFGRWIRST